MEHSLRFDTDRPWRMLTLIASAVAAIEFAVIFGAFAARPLVTHLKNAAIAHAAEQDAGPIPKKPPVGTARLPRSKTSVLVLNGNGRTGAAAAESSVVRRRGYKVSEVGDAKRTDYTRSVVMYRAGFRAEAFRLGRDLRVSAVGPLDGMKPGDLRGTHLVLVVGKSPR